MEGVSVTPAAARKIPLLDLSLEHSPIRAEILREVTRVIDSQRFIGGEDIAALEREVAAYCDAKFAIGCASGTDALFLALMALGIGPGDRVLTTPYTFFATAGAICRIGAEPVFVDIQASDFNIDVSQVERALTKYPRVKAIIPVHLFGACADLDPLMELAAQHRISVIEDAAQAIGAECNGRRAGSIGAMACFSFFPTKNLGAMGDAGMLTTNDAALAEKLSALRVHGSKKRYYHEWIGINSRLDSLQAAILRVKLKYLDTWTEARQRNAAQYREAFEQRGVPVTVPMPAAHQTRHVFNQFVICGARRDALRAHLQQIGVGCEIYYPVPLHLQSCLAYLGGKPGDFPVSERVANESLALPIQPGLDMADIEYIVEGIAAFYEQS
jgi:dTDP-4-amino-4,6-dideoxygalactose transaminase